MDNVFYNIKVHSYFSLLESALSIDDIIAHALKYQQEYVVLTDKNLSGAMDFYLSAKKHNLKPVIGLDFFINNQNYLLIAKSNIGYHNLVKLHSLQNLNVLKTWDQYLDDVIVISQEKPFVNCRDWYHTTAVALNTVKVLNQDKVNILQVLQAIKHDCLLKEIEPENQYYAFYNYLQACDVFTPEQIRLNQTIIEQCEWNINPRKPRLAKFKLPDNTDSKTHLQSLCVNGLKQSLNTSNAMDKRYVDRLLYELKVINDMGYNDYFLIVADFVNFAKSNQILIGPGRGSAAGSLVAFALGITEVDPIENNLIFERFLNPGRSSLPDIDIDVMDTRRQEVIDYIFNKYDPTHCSYIATFQHIKAKMALRDVGRILGVPLSTVDIITKSLSFNDEISALHLDNNESLKGYYETYPELFDLAKSIIGIPRQTSTHAAGIIIADKPIYEYIPVQSGIDQWNLCEFSMDYLEGLGLFKIDILGLKNLTIINEVLELIWKHQAIKVDLRKIKLDDQKIFNEISNADTIGIFQLESPGMRNTLRKIKPRSIEDISITSALFRPGPQAMINDYVKTREGKLQPQYISPAVEPFLASTLGFCIYQEQVMELVTAITNFSMAEADVFRRAISKKNEALFTQMRARFVSAAIENKYAEKEATRIFDFLLDFANYGFNHSHSLAYSYISYQMMHLKHYYPLEFILVLLKYGDTSNLKNNLYISEAKRKGIPIYNVSIRKSCESFSIADDGIIFGFSNIKGMGMEIAKRIVATRNEYSEQFKNWENAITILSRKATISNKTLETLIKVGAFDEFAVDRNFMLANLEEILNKANIVNPETNEPIFSLQLDNDVEPMSEKQKSDWEFTYLSFTFSNDQYTLLFNQYKEEYKLLDLSTQLNLNNIDEKQNFLIRINNLKKTMTKTNHKMCFIEFSSNSVDYSIACFNMELCNHLQQNTYAICQFKLDNNKRLQMRKVVVTLNH